jgi:hypothetical protein
LQEDGRHFHFRHASARERRIAGIEKSALHADSSVLEYHFFETYGYRFTLLVSPSKKTGTVYDLERLVKYKPADIALKSARARYEAACAQWAIGQRPSR